MSRPPLEIAGRTAIVTGAGSGIGRALALEAARRGMAVAACDVDAGGLSATVKAVRAQGVAGLIAEPLDITSREELDGFAARIPSALPPPVLLFANAGILRRGSVLTMPAAEWEAVVRVNLLGAVATVQALAPLLAPPAQIVLTGSTGSMTLNPGLGAYCATKHALWPIADVLREELAAEGRQIGVSLLMPGAVATQIFQHADPGRPAPADAIPPDEAARIAFDGALADKRFILTHESYLERIGERFTDAVDALAG